LLQECDRFGELCSSIRVLVLVEGRRATAGGDDRVVGTRSRHVPYAAARAFRGGAGKDAPLGARLLGPALDGREGLDERIVVGDPLLLLSSNRRCQEVVETLGQVV
jgi:hypothetical protein